MNNSGLILRSKGISTKLRVWGVFLFDNHLTSMLKNAKLIKKEGVAKE